jgi:hypothetical protein
VAKYNYPPDAEAKPIELVIRQMETFAEDWTPNAAYSGEKKWLSHRRWTPVNLVAHADIDESFGGN